MTVSSMPEINDISDRRTEFTNNINQIYPSEIEKCHKIIINSLTS